MRGFVMRRARTKKLGRTFYRQDADALARGLLGKVLVHRLGGRVLRGRIVETEAYMGPEDLASHSSKGLTKRTQVMFGPPGHAYVYFIYGMHEMFNIVCGKRGAAHAVLIRAAEPLDGWEANLSGPGRLARAFGFARSDNGLDLTGERIYVEAGEGEEICVIASRRIGVDYAGHWKEAPLRFSVAGCRAVSRPWPK